MLLPYTTLTYYGPCAAAMYPQDSMGEGFMEATPHQKMGVALTVVGTGGAPVLRPYRGYAAALTAAGDSFVQITPHQNMKVKMTVNVGAVPSAEDIAQSIWNSSAAKYNYPNTMGNRLNAAGSGGVDYNALAAAVWAYVIESGISAEEAMRIYGAVLAGKVSGAGTGTEVFTGLDGTTVRVTSTVDASGNRTAVTVNGA